MAVCVSRLDEELEPKHHTMSCRRQRGGYQGEDNEDNPACIVCLGWN